MVGSIGNVFIFERRAAWIGGLQMELILFVLEFFGLLVAAIMLWIAIKTYRRDQD